MVQIAALKKQPTLMSHSMSSKMPKTVSTQGADLKVTQVATYRTKNHWNTVQSLNEFPSDEQFSRNCLYPIATC